MIRRSTGVHCLGRVAILFVVVGCGVASAPATGRPAGSDVASVRLGRRACDLPVRDVLSVSVMGPELGTASDDAWTRSLPCVVGWFGAPLARRSFALDFPAPHDGTSLGWECASRSTEGRVVAVLESRVEGGLWDLPIVTSDDDGRTWFVRGEVRKPHYMADVSRFEILDQRRWRITFDLDDCADCGVTPGTYVLETEDAGAVWRATSAVEPVVPAALAECRR